MMEQKQDEQHVHAIKKLVNTDIRFNWHKHNFNMREVLDYIDKMEAYKTSHPAYYYSVVFDLLYAVASQMFNDRRNLKGHLDTLFDNAPFDKAGSQDMSVVNELKQEIEKLRNDLEEYKKKNEEGGGFD